jgi:hypothetical protein
MQKKISPHRLISFLEIHKITRRQRAKMVNWILEVLKIFESSLETAFRAVLCLDLFLKCLKTPLRAKELHLLGVVCIFISSKLSETRSISMRQLIRDIGKFQFSVREIKDMEMRILTTVNFNINLPTIWCFGNLLVESLELPEFCAGVVGRYAELFQKMFLFSYDILNVFSFEQLAGFSLVISLKLFEYTHKGFCPQKFNSQVLQLVNMGKIDLLANLNFLRDFVSSFGEKFPFNTVNKP